MSLRRNLATSVPIPLSCGEHGPEGGEPGVMPPLWCRDLSLSRSRSRSRSSVIDPVAGDVAEEAVAVATPLDGPADAADADADAAGNSERAVRSKPEEDQSLQKHQNAETRVSTEPARSGDCAASCAAVDAYLCRLLRLTLLSALLRCVPLLPLPASDSARDMVGDATPE